ncbi:MAG: hypothetical protein WCI63_01015 [bacterium]
MENKSGDDGQQNLDDEMQIREIEKHLGTRYEDATPSELIGAEIRRLVEAPDRSIDLGISEDEAANLSKALEAQKSKSNDKIYDWGSEHGIVRTEGESDLSYLLRIHLARTKADKQGESSESIKNEDQESLF